MIIAVIILAWLFVNTWITLIFAQIERTSFSGWDELFTLLLCAIFNPFIFMGVCLAIRRIIKRIKRKKNPNEGKVYYAEYED